jgi:hypothetical protein
MIRICNTFLILVLLVFAGYLMMFYDNCTTDTECEVSIPNEAKYVPIQRY